MFMMRVVVAKSPSLRHPREQSAKNISGGAQRHREGDDLVSAKAADNAARSKDCNSAPTKRASFPSSLSLRL